MCLVLVQDAIKQTRKQLQEVAGPLVAAQKVSQAHVDIYNARLRALDDLHRQVEEMKKTLGYDGSCPSMDPCFPPHS